MTLTSAPSLLSPVAAFAFADVEERRRVKGSLRLRLGDLPFGLAFFSFFGAEFFFVRCGDDVRGIQIAGLPDAEVGCVVCGELRLTTVMARGRVGKGAFPTVGVVGEVLGEGLGEGLGGADGEGPGVFLRAVSQSEPPEPRDCELVALDGAD